ncbi:MULTISPECIES: S8 family serine peptidase [Paraburkholderia]|uniref:S8 family serine peptidase n=1 Tax=Paraburkholderia TaxID=1822464 RepID=UPI000A014650|nr:MULTISPECIES: S8 family serine peptidase [Paraburkholderia]MDH6147402.1 subtilisin family serine protease [Paraburkholderia sp. WSM4179]
MQSLDVVQLPPLMEITAGRPDIAIGLIDGPVATMHDDLERVRIKELSLTSGSTCVDHGSSACSHGTFVAGILSARRGTRAPAICPDCTLVVRPIFDEDVSHDASMPSATPDEVAAAIFDCVQAGVRLLNLSSALTQLSIREERKLEDALDYAMRRGVIIVAAAGNQRSVGSSAITRHPAVIPVAACEMGGRPLGYSNLGHSIGRYGLIAPGDAVTSLAPQGNVVTSSGTSVAAPFVTGAVALIWSQFPSAHAQQIRVAIAQAHTHPRRSIVPPLLNAWATYLAMTSILQKVAK